MFPHSRPIVVNVTRFGTCRLIPLRITYTSGPDPFRRVPSAKDRLGQGGPPRDAPVAMESRRESEISYTASQPYPQPSITLRLTTCRFAPPSITYTSDPEPARRFPSVRASRSGWPAGSTSSTLSGMVTMSDQLNPYAPKVVGLGMCRLRPARMTNTCEPEPVRRVPSG